MEDIKAINTEIELLSKLRTEIEKSWNGGISKRTVKDIIESKHRSRKDIE